MKTLLIIFAIIATVSPVYSARRVATSLTRSPPEAFFGLGTEVAHALQMVNTDYPGYIDLQIAEDYGNSANIIANYHTFINETPDALLLGAIGSPGNIALKNAFISQGIQSEILGLNVAAREWYTAVHPDDPVYISVNPSSPLFGIGSLNALRVAGARNMTIIQASHPFVRQICEGVAAVAKLDYGIDVLNTLDIPATLGKLPSTNTTVLALLTNAILTAVAEKADVIYACDFTGGINWMLQELKRLNYTPRAFVSGYYAAFEVNSLNNTEIFDYVLGTDNVHPYFGATEIADSITPKYVTFTNFANTYKAIYNVTPSAGAGSAYAAGAIIVEALRVMGENRPSRDIFNTFLLRRSFDTFMGQIKWNYNLEQEGHTPVVQRQLAALQEIIYPDRFQTKRFVYPMPTWAERVVREIGPGSDRPFRGIEIAVFVLGIVAIALILAVMVLIAIYRGNNHVRAGQWVWLIVGCVGSILILVGVLLWRVEDGTTAASCIVGPAVAVVGFYLLYGALMAKSWRILMLFDNSSLKVYSIRDKHVFIFMSLIAMLPCTVFIVWWAVVGNPVVIPVVVDPFRPSENYPRCQFASESKIPIWVGTAFTGLLLIAGCVMAIMSKRTVKDKKYDDTGFITMSSFVSFVLAVVIFAVQIAFGSSRETEELAYGLRSIFMIVLACGTVGIVGYGRISKMLKGKDTSISSGRSHSNSTHLSTKNNKGSTV